MDGASAVGPTDPPGICAVCHRILPLENDTIDLESISICGDCKFLFLEDNGTPTQDIRHRNPRVRRIRYTNSSESIENMFSQQFSTMINQARQNPPVVSDLDNQSVDSVHTTSRRWRRVVSDTESEGFDSVYGDSDATGAISYGVYGGDSDASVDVHSFLGDSDTDIDPMHAGLNQWSSDDEWEEVEDGDNNTLGSLITRVQLQRSMESNTESGPVRIRINERNQVHITTPFGMEHEIQESSPYVGHSGDYLDARSFEELLERLAEADGSRRGAPPAAVSFVDNLDCVVVEEGECDGVACAICKESLSVGSVVNQLPCFHVYHGSCIKPWLSARNSCPLCRYELPTDDMEYENRKESSGHGFRVEETQDHENDDEDEEEDVSFEGQEMVNDESGNGSGSGRGRWLFVVSLVGIGLALWFGNPEAIRGSGSGSCGPSQRGNRSRRWWSLF